MLAMGPQGLLKQNVDSGNNMVSTYAEEDIKW